MKAYLKTLCIVFPAIVFMAGTFYSCKENKSGESQTLTVTEPFPQASAVPEPLMGSNANFVTAARSVTPGVVHIKTIHQGQPAASRYFGGGYGSSTPSMGSGSGVVISADGYIATNNHVIENANSIEVVFPSRQSYPAKLIGRDPNTDLALLKVDAKDLPFVALGNSDNVQVGEWVLAVGYPYSLNTTVTAGIVSAKGRSIGIINRSGATRSQQANPAIESFIQTDAAINPGNSGGALVNLNGQLIGINTAIASLTGSYAGYAFAVPVNLAKKILDDLKEFGMVKRGLLGVTFPSPSVEDQYLKQQGIDPGSVKGVFITGIQDGSAADEAGLKEGDIISRINGVELFSSAEFSERIARLRPGDKVELEYRRNGNIRRTAATLKEETLQKSIAGSAESLEKIYNKLGAKFSPLTPELKQRYNLEAGVVVTEVLIGGFFDRLGVPPGTIISYINGRSVSSPKDIDQALMDAMNSRVQMLGIAPDGSRIAFNFSLGA